MSVVIFYEHYSVFKSFQSGLRALHSAETALVKVASDLSLTADRGDCLNLILLELIAAFDKVNHRILLYCLEILVGIKVMALSSLCSDLSHRNCSVTLSNSAYLTALLRFGVPQGPLCF